MRLAVCLNDGMLDPQGEAIARTLQEMTDGMTDGMTEEMAEEMVEVDKETEARVATVRVGKLLDIELSARDVEHARSAVEKMSERLLTHPVTEKSEFVGEILELEDS